MRVVFDIEGDELRDRITKIWCAVFKDIDTGEVYKYDVRDDGFYQELITFLNNVELLIGHNIISYDIPVFKKILGYNYTGSVWDTLVVSRLLFPDRPGGHSLEAWGERFERKKPEHEDWSQFSEEMLHRCSEDVEINHLLYRYQIKGISKSSADWSQAIQTEHKVAEIITRQEIHGVAFDVDRANYLVDNLTKEMDELYQLIRPSLKFDVDQPYGDRPVNTVFLKDGSYSRFTLAWYDDPSNVAGPFCRVEFEEPDLGSRYKLIKQLLLFGWEPEEFTDSGTPKLTNKGKPVDTLDRIKGDIGKNIARWYTLSHRRSQIRGWLMDRRLQVDGRLTAGANPCGTPTGRMRHNTVVNVPKAAKEVIYGKEMRSLFIASPSYKLVGHDASGLENRMLAHYMNDPELTKEILGGDFHSKVWETIKEYVHSRNNTKNIEYALFYGASDGKLGSMVDYKPAGWSNAQMGKEIRRLIMQGLPALDQLTKRVQKDAKRGYLIGLDGRKLHVRSEHSALNTLLQGAGAIVMKKSMTLLDEWVKKERLDVHKVIDMHDEAQAEVHPRDVERYRELAVKSIEEAGRFFKMNVPLTGESKVGTNWAETH